MGIGKATVKKDGKLCTFVVARYRPPGDIIGAVRPNVLKGDFNVDYCRTLGGALKTMAGMGLGGPGGLGQQGGIPPNDAEYTETVTNPKIAQQIQNRLESTIVGDDPAADGASANKKGKSLTLIFLNTVWQFILFFIRLV